MADIKITTDGTINGTKLIVDGKELTKDDKVVSISLFARAPFKSSYGDIYKGGVSVEFASVNDSGTLETKSYGSTDTQFTKGIGQKVKQEDQVIRYVGQEVDAAVCGLVDKIVKHCEDNKLVCPEKEVLLSRSLESLQDKAGDLGIKLED